MFFDRQGRCLRTNRTGLSILGCPESEVIGRTLRELFPEPYRAAVDEAVAGAAAGRQTSFAAATPSRTGGTVSWQAGLTPFVEADGAVDGFAGIFVDVTAHVRTGELLRESEERYRELIEGAHDMIQSVAPDGRYLFVNRAWRETLGYAPEEIAGLTFADILCPGQAEHCAGIFRDVMAGKSVDRVETVFVAKGGARIAVEGSVSARVAGGRVVATQGIFRNVSERRDAEEQIRAKASLLELSADAILLLSPEAEFIYFNSALERMTGYSREELLSRKLHGIEPPEYADRIRPNIAMLFERGEAVFESAYLRRDGSILPVEVHAIVTELSGKRVIMSLVRDISERKAALEAVRSAEKRFRDLLDTIQLAAVILDAAGAIIYGNDYLLGLTGRSREEVLGRDWFATFIPEPQREEVRRLFGASLAPGTPPLHHETPILTRDDRLRQIAWDNTILRGPDGTAVGTASIGNDVTERRRLEEQLRHSQKMQAIGQLAGGVAHDFNNILTAIIGYSHLIFARMKADDPSRLLVEHVLQAADRAATLTQNLLAFGRKQVMNRKPHDLTAIVARLEKFLLRLIRENIELARESDGRVLTVFADDSQIEQVLMNLVTNACDAMPQGGRVTIRTELRRMDRPFLETRGFGKEGAYACLAVADTGVGMDAATRERIFEPFFTTKERGRGTGLGLAMADGIVSQHEGFIEVESRPGEGTTFRIYLPLFGGAAPEERPAAAAAPARGGSETILVAEDDAALRRLISMVLGNAGYRVVEAVNGEDAIRKFGEADRPVDLLLLDGIMPKKGGREACREIRMIAPGVKALFITGYAEEITGGDGPPEPGIAVLLKPLIPSVLLKKVREVLDGGG